jgi:Flp pilus assembly protein TadD
MEEAIAHAGENYNTTIPIHNSLGALGKTEALRNYEHREIAIYEEHLKKVPEDARVRVLLGLDYAIQGRFDEAKREADMAMALRPDDSMILYNTACLFCQMNNVPDALNAIRKAWESGYRDAVWTRQDPDLELLHGNEEFEKLYPAASGEIAKAKLATD